MKQKILIIMAVVLHAAACFEESIPVMNEKIQMFRMTCNSRDPFTPGDANYLLMSLRDLQATINNMVEFLEHATE